MKFKVRELTYPNLDVAVAMALGEDYQLCTEWDGIGNEYPPTQWSTNWAQGGPVVERFGICFQTDQMFGYTAYFKSHGTAGVTAGGPTHLVAAMRCVVASRYGDWIDLL